MRNICLQIGKMKMYAVLLSTLSWAIFNKGTFAYLSPQLPLSVSDLSVSPLLVSSVRSQPSNRENK